MAQKDFYIILPSNVKTSEDSATEENLISQYTTILPARLRFPPYEDWRVAVTDFSYKQTWFNILKESKIKFMLLSGLEVEPHLSPESKEDMVVEAGFYETIDSLVMSINAKLALLKEKYDTAPKLYYNPNSHIVSIFPGKFTSSSKESLIIPLFGIEVERLLGLTQVGEKNLATRLKDADVIFKNKIISTKKIKGTGPGDINAGFNNFFIYTNIVQQSYVGNTSTPILTSVPTKRSVDGWGGSVHHKPKNLIYRPLQVHSLDTIDIQITDDKGQLVPFKKGNIVVILHFKSYG